jgi:hypothetical protein
MPLLLNFAKLCLSKQGEIVDAESGEVVDHWETKLGDIGERSVACWQSIECRQGKGRMLCLVA